MAWLPFCVLYTLSDGFYIAMYYLLRYRRRVVRENLAMAFAERTVEERRTIERAFYKHLCDVFLETIKLLHISDKELEQRIVVNGGELVEKYGKEGRSVVVFLGHYGNWEWAQKITWHFTTPTIKGSIYRPVKDRVVDRVMLTIRGRFGAELVPQKQAIRQLLAWTKGGQQWAIGFISDQRPNSKNLHHWTTFLRQPTPYALGGEEIGRHVDAAYVYLDVEKTSRGHYAMTYKPLLSDSPTLEFMQQLETIIERQPAYWLWSHKRWSVKPGDIQTWRET